jgi:hypothetical protein
MAFTGIILACNASGFLRKAFEVGTFGNQFFTKPFEWRRSFL